MTERNNLFHYGIITAAFALAFDQASKLFLIAYFPQDADSVTVTPFFNLVMVWNYGISFGMLAGHRQPLILGILSSGIVLFLMGWLWRCQDKMASIALGLVIGGAVGNIIDRLRFGAVADFLDFHAAGYHWPAFNIADSCIFIGVVLLCIHSMLIESKHTHKGSQP